MASADVLGALISTFIGMIHQGFFFGQLEGSFIN